MSVVAEAALLQHVHGVGVRPDEVRFGVTIEAATLETKPAAAADPVALPTGDPRKRRMLLKSAEARRRIRAAEETDFLAAARPHERQAMFARGRGKLGMKYVGKRLFGRNWMSVEFQAARGGGGDDVDRGAGEGRTVHRAQNSGGVLRGQSGNGKTRNRQARREPPRR